MSAEQRAGAAVDAADHPGYQQRIYDRYVSAFKDRLPGEALRADFARHAQFFDHLLRPVTRALSSDANVLEVACGQGRFLFWAQTRGYSKVRGFDISAEQVAVARELGLKAEVAAAGKYLPACGHDFDLVVAMDVLEHFAKDSALTLLEQCRDCLKPNGLLFLTTPNGAALRPGPVVYGDLTHETIFSPDTIRLALHLTGFDAVQVYEVAPGKGSVRSRIRGLLWRVVRTGAGLIDLIETGRQRVYVHSRVMAVVARRAPSVAVDANTTTPPDAR